jgi:hypothetical protein
MCERPVRVAPEETLRTLDVRLSRLARAGCAVNHDIDVVHGLLEPGSRQQISRDRAETPAPAESPNVAAGVTQAIHDPTTERARTSRDENFRRIHKTSFTASPGWGDPH